MLSFYKVAAKLDDELAILGDVWKTLTPLVSNFRDGVSPQSFCDRLLTASYSSEGGASTMSSAIPVQISRTRDATDTPSDLQSPSAPYSPMLSCIASRYRGRYDR
ncbi:hypothetical protein BDN71DRAFT_541186 [Pleurotus eryngii]|uniref:Uncharacterized protein n=1 Tax=Pleurotus eryngii TaxID=5323 RepID=A0A9P5ZH30_PLEER|nr:hypothetical protein BDN71DRAFT_541186 [Pleurotus eryngii]